MVSCFLSTNFLNDFWEWKRRQFMDRIQGNRTNVRLSWSYHSRYRDRQSSEAERISFSLSCCPRTRTEDWVAVSTRSFTASFGATSTISFLHFLLAVTFLSKYKISASLSLFVCTVSFRTEWTSLFQSIETNTDKQAVGYLSEERERERETTKYSRLDYSKNYDNVITAKGKLLLKRHLQRKWWQDKTSVKQTRSKWVFTKMERETNTFILHYVIFAREVDWESDFQTQLKGGMKRVKTHRKWQTRPGRTCKNRRLARHDGMISKDWLPKSLLSCFRDFDDNARMSSLIDPRDKRHSYTQNYTQNRRRKTGDDRHETRNMRRVIKRWRTRQKDKCRHHTKRPLMRDKTTEKTVERKKGSNLGDPEGNYTRKNIAEDDRP